MSPDGLPSDAQLPFVWGIEGNRHTKTLLFPFQFFIVNNSGQAFYSANKNAPPTASLPWTTSSTGESQKFEALITHKDRLMKQLFASDEEVLA